MRGFVRGNFFRVAMAFVAGGMLSACGGADLEAVEDVDASPASHTASYIPPCTGQQAWIIYYYSTSNPSQEVGRMECTCEPKIYRYGTTSGNSQLYYEQVCGQL
ncbi:hypothetical protein HPC49_39780 [Pyxidicoccus fallax]|uniref:Lipoprotein n=1 Tax=Pyxidicoccus fallax TaxID=394095 RepID=A0A848LYA0_9BACT|nr:hypothetical protein [Pyxidicoccus fallax]NMO23168.1 hypothetical protein [Pyxidicoccus fallax]NPC84339.1 hypothetical protein [Pyxidicoccus fallax]